MQKKLEERIVLFSLWLLMFSSSSQFFIMSPILSQIGEQLTIPEQWLGTLITAYAISLAIMALMIGPISDRYGRRKILLVGCGSSAIVLLLHPLAYNYYSLLTLRILAGLAGGVLAGSCVAYVGDYFSIGRRGWANGIVATGSAAGQIIGIPMGTLLSGWIGFYAPFQFFGVMIAIAFVVILIKLPQPILPNQNCKTGVFQASRDYLKLLREPGVKSIAMGYILSFFSISIFIVYFPTWLENSFRIDNYEIAILFLIGGIATVLAGPISGRLSDKRGRGQIIVLTNLILAIALPISVFVLNQHYVFYPVVFFVIMVFIVARRVPFQTLAGDIVQDQHRGRMMSLTLSIGQIGMALGSGLAGLVYTQIGFIGNAVFAAIACFTMAIIIQRYFPDYQTKRKIANSRLS
ncbi:MFS transporter [Reichenbachiella agariperforans]|uniref:Predicted arabinose efflux permease, MFS family n=1 Tax=Reichenbachiella agariperforans TaxID=156994 RepID=A0A1M6L4C1_REIAG|nr:MFS transporter [Reichenbachiella agariperforans]MBU2913782.1 MFS transporter [Reichenbachiella agariperforans]SHJ66003.1 Predicted arabinose efflux permease, MFS family [Reichenbachiella agariperforans]